MQAIRARNKGGSILLLEPLKAVQEAELFDIVLDNDSTADLAVNAFHPSPTNPVEAFKAIGLANFFDNEVDNNLDWDDLFDIKPR